MIQNYLFILVIGIIAIGGSSGLSYIKGRQDCQALMRAERLADEKEALERIISTLTSASVENAERAKADRALIEELQGQIDEIPENRDVCLPADSARRLQRIR